MNKEVSETTDDIDADDVLNTKSQLKNLGYYQTPDYGMTKISDRSMFDGIRKFQTDNKLTVDGVMKPQGETESTFNKILRNGEYASTAAQQGLSLGWADEAEGVAGGIGYGIGSLNKKWNKTDETFGQAFKRGYVNTRDARRANLEEGYKRNPVLTGAAEVTGAIASPAKFAKTNPLEPIANLKRKNLLDAVGGGAVYGAGASKNEASDYAKNIGLGVAGNVMGNYLGNKAFGRASNSLGKKIFSESVNTGLNNVANGVLHKDNKNNR